MIHASIPIFDWQGPQFLAFYAIAYVGAVIWTLHLGKARMKRFNARGEPAEPTDPFDIAYLAGGPARAVKLAVGRLIHRGLIVWSKKWTGDRLAATRLASGDPLHPLETIVLTRVIAAGDKGIRVDEAGYGCSAPLSSIASRLAFAGLRPTEQELKNSALSCVWPMPLLLIIGFIKMFIGISRHRPIGLLMIGLGLSFLTTFILVAMVVNRSGRVTTAGTRMIERLRERHPNPAGGQSGLPLWSMGLALGGVYAMTGVPDIDMAYHTMNRRDPFGAQAAPDSSSGCGGSACGGGGSSCGGGSGCGGSSCGSGCGGCGGGGD